MKALEELLEAFVPSREYVWGNPDTMRITAEDVREWENSNEFCDFSAESPLHF